MDEPSDWALLARYLSGESSEEEKAEVEAAIASDPEKQRLITSMRTVWETPEPQAGPSDGSRLWDDIAEKTGIAAGPEVARNRSRQRIAGRLVEWLQPQPKLVRYYAAAAVLLIVSPLAYYWSQETGIFPFFRQTQLTLAVESGASDQLTLSDGTRIRLDAGSILRYPEAFGG